MCCEQSVRMLKLCPPSSCILKEGFEGPLLDAAAHAPFCDMFLSQLNNGQSTAGLSRAALQVKYSPHSPGLPMSLTFQGSDVISLQHF